ncbi:hypothetical protein WDM22_33020 [Bradyrhizobium septentrionale]|uniref:hypothetical protein n=1 Tax=Bradyrhizobium septentrionale TaxID=1404411 RepID=UPI0030D1D641
MTSKTLNSHAVRWSRGDDWGIDTAWSGTAMIYAARGTMSFALSGDYEVSYRDESEPDDMRAARLFRASQGEAVREAHDEKLGDELVIIFGAKVTAAKAVRTLKALVARIEDEGLIIGRVGGGDFVHETVGRELTVEDARSFDVSD